MEKVARIIHWIPVLKKFGKNFKEFPSDEIELQFNSAMVSALVYRQPQHPDIEIWVERALSLAENSSNLSLKLQTISTVAFFRMQMGSFGKALLAINSIRKLSQSRDATPFIRIRLGVLESSYYRFVGLYEKCLKAVTDGLELSRATGIHVYEISLLYHGVSSAVSASDQATAARLLEEMGTSLKSLKPFDLCTYYSAKTQESLFRGDPNQALIHVELAMKLRIESGYTILKGWCHIQNAYVMHELGRYREAAEHLTQAFDFAREINGKSTEYGALLARSLFAFDQGKKEAGLFSLREAFALGRERGYFGTWGPPPSGMTKLCNKALEAGIEVEYVQEIIRRLRLIPDQPPLHLENWPWPCKIYTLGQFRLEKDGNPIQFTRKVQQKPLSLLKSLIAFGGRGVQETKIADALWPEADGDDAHHSFVTNLHRLRKLIGHENAILFKDGKLNLDHKYCWVDAFAFEHTLRQAEDNQKSGSTEDTIKLVEKAIALYGGSFLGEEIEQPWMISLRERLRSKFLWGITWLGRCWRENEQWEKAIRCYQRGLELDGMAEELYQHLMTCYQRLGQDNEALSVYNRLKRTLSAVLGVEPSSKTKIIYKSLIP
ncbi:MAG: tetratricopeptide repeat protein [Deltaproteobacteria bacterium]|nr:tetratricopeptide repeat protein [Deltaproteobacteria bacterium]